MRVFNLGTPAQPRSAAAAAQSCALLQILLRAIFPHLSFDLLCCPVHPTTNGVHFAALY
jgi:hypothetical protein